MLLSQDPPNTTDSLALGLFCKLVTQNPINFFDLPNGGKINLPIFHEQETIQRSYKWYFMGINFNGSLMRNIWSRVGYVLDAVNLTQTQRTFSLRSL